MELNYTSIEKFQAIQSGDNLIIVGLGSDGWCYQFHGEEGAWVRLSKSFPYRIVLAEPPINSSETKPMEPEIIVPPEASVVEAGAEAPAEPAV